MYINKRLIVIFIYFILVNLLGLFIILLDYASSFLSYETDSYVAVFDYIVVGCGSAGAIVARRLAEDPNVQVLVLETGKYGNSLLDIPMVGLLLQKTPCDWQYTTVPQSASCFALNNNVSNWPMGKIVGGNGMFNNMMYIRGHPQDFYEWFQNKEGYSYEKNVLPYFEKLENNASTGKQSGSTYIKDLTFTSLLPSFILDAAKTLGFSVLDDLLNCQEGFGIPKANLHNGMRWSPAHHLIQAKKSNVHLRTNRFVQKILLHDNFEAYGVQYSHLDRSYIARASKGVILSAGVIGTPKVLLHSGIGPKFHLDEVNISTKVDLPVGENLQDHVTTGFDLILLNQSLGVGLEQMLSPYAMFNYFWSGTGPWTTVGCEVLAFINTESNTTTREANLKPDLQFMVMPLGITEDNGVYLRHLIGISDETWNNYFSLLNQTSAVTMLPVLLHPKSRGTVRLRNSDFKSKPLIDPKYLSSDSDVEILLKGINYIKELINTEAMRNIGARFNENVLPSCAQFVFDTKAYWECYVRHLTVTAYHPVGTCKMGHDKDTTSVVNFSFEVIGTNNLFVVDGSVMPTLTSGNINGAIMMLAEMASDIFKLKQFLISGQCNIKEIFFVRNFC